MRKLLTSFIVSCVLATSAQASKSVTSPSFEKFVLERSCRSIISGGRKNMPVLSVYVLNKIEPKNLSFGNDCHIHNLVFAQCLVEPQLSVEQAVDALIQKALAGAELPRTSSCSSSSHDRP
jgi:hypothetical protein